MRQTLTEEQFFILQDFIFAISSIDLAPSKKYLVEQRLGPILDQYKLQNFDELINMLATPSTDFVDTIISAITTNETFFFRDTHIYDAIEKFIIPELFEKAKTSRIRIWSSASSSGQEAYTISMLLTEYAQKNILAKNLLSKFEIKATDIDPKILKKAKSGRYSSLEVSRGLNDYYLKKYFIDEDNSFVVKDEIKKMVNFSRANLTDAFFPLNNDFILCRNVLIYFDTMTKKQIIEKMHKTLKKGGYLLLGSSETLMGLYDGLKRVQKGSAIFYVNN